MGDDRVTMDTGTRTREAGNLKNWQNKKETLVTFLFPLEER